MEESKKSTNKIIAIVLAILLLSSVAYLIYTKQKHEELTDAIEEEKEEIEQNLDSMIVRYEDAISENTAMSNELEFERDRIIALRDSIKGLKAENYGLIRRYRRQIAKLEEKNRRLLFRTDSLINMNELLTIDLDSAHVKISDQLALNDTLTLQNIELTEKVTLGSLLRTNSAKVLAMRERNNGKLVQTSRSRNTDAFRINFKIAKNEISEPGERQIYMQITDNEGNIIANKGEVSLSDEVQINYSDATTVDYLNEEIDIISLVEVDRKMIEKGDYYVNIFIENKLSGVTRISLK